MLFLTQIKIVRMYFPQQYSSNNNVEGMCDIIGCRNEDASISVSPFIVKFINVLRNKPVVIHVNGSKTTLTMKVNERNEGYFESDEADPAFADPAGYSKDIV